MGMKSYVEAGGRQGVKLGQPVRMKAAGLVFLLDNRL
jgi:hypothetical protein